MKSVKIFFLILVNIIVFIFSTELSAQNSQFICGTPVEMPNLSKMRMNKVTDFEAPLCIPATGTIRALVVYVQFPDDNTSDPFWTSGQMPSFYNDIIDPNIVQTYRQNTLSDFYRVMSNGTTTSGMNLIGDIRTVLATVPHDMSYYKDSELTPKL